MGTEAIPKVSIPEVSAFPDLHCRWKEGLRRGLLLVRKKYLVLRNSRDGKATKTALKIRCAENTSFEIPNDILRLFKI